ncbi:hypothetical protein [Sinorhizobium mexicanum]|uniref:hypothetical protein n=1 Tax=Sinorhizobium mexicanum TaxID=375549 RepID=UPI001FE56B90|nr:hypothetical protein [Sinorhizobium mexicanum]
MGDVIVDEGDIYGDGVNVAARLEGLAEPGGIYVSARVQEDVRGKVDIILEGPRGAAAQKYCLARQGLPSAAQRRRDSAQSGFSCSRKWS